MQSLLIIGYVWPEPTATAAGSRMLQIIEQFKLLGYAITFASPAQKPNTAFNLSSIDVVEQTIELNADSFDVFLKELNPNVVIFDRFMMEEQFGWRVANISPNALRILDSEDLHFLRKARQEAVKKGLALPTGIIHSDEAKREIASIYRCDVTLTISEFEMEYLQQVYKIPQTILWYLPFMIEVKEHVKADFNERQDFLFIGNFIHEPNWDAVLQLKTQLWPEIKKQLPKAKMHVYGGYPSSKVLQLHNPKEKFLVHGRAEDVHSVMQQVKVCLAPLRYGAGLKGKLIDAMLNSTPFVTTKLGAEGMFGDIDFTDSISCNNQDFVKKSVALYTNINLWSLSVEKGQRVLKTRFDKLIHQKDFANTLNDFIENKEAFRNQNFVGAMLQHHTLKSSMYLSKWITEKNKG